MGLDMYLYGIKSNKESKFEYGDHGTWEECCYWRKANQVHKFFKDNFIKDQDPWGYYEVTEEKLDELKLKCYFILMNKDSEERENVALALLPPDNFGCCFGSVEIDDDYFDDIEETYNKIKEILDVGYKKIFYKASW